MWRRWSWPRDGAHCVAGRPPAAAETEACSYRPPGVSAPSAGCGTCPTPCSWPRSASPLPPAFGFTAAARGTGNCTPCSPHWTRGLGRGLGWSVASVRSGLQLMAVSARPVATVAVGVVGGAVLMVTQAERPYPDCIRSVAGQLGRYRCRRSPGGASPAPCSVSSPSPSGFRTPAGRLPPIMTMSSRGFRACPRGVLGRSRGGLRAWPGSDPRVGGLRRAPAGSVLALPGRGGSGSSG
jgi:hypothetical protein